MAEKNRTAWLPVALAGALSGAALTAACFTLSQQSSKWWRAKATQLESLYPDGANRAIPQYEDSKRGGSLSNAFSDEILAEQFTRNTQFFGREGQSKIHRAFVIVVGLGVSLACHGTSNLRLWLVA